MVSAALLRPQPLTAAKVCPHCGYTGSMIPNVRDDASCLICGYVDVPEAERAAAEEEVRLARLGRMPRRKSKHQ